MGLLNSSNKYGSLARFFHWTLAGLFLFQFASIVAYRFMGQNPPALAWEILNWHKECGLLILFLGALRLIWRVVTTLPDWHPDFGAWDKRLSHFAERSLYGALFVMTASGIVLELTGGHYVPFFGLFYLDNVAPYLHGSAVAKDAAAIAAREAGSLPLVSQVLVAVHVVGAYAVVALVAVHLAHVLHHQLGPRDGLLARMVPGRRWRS